MFTAYHFAWIGICAMLIACSLIYIHKRQVCVKRLLPICCAVSAISEIIKTFSVLKMVPSADGSTFYPYLELQYFPLHMCSLMIFGIFYLKYGKNERRKSDLHGFLYAAGILGGILGIGMPSIFSSVAPAESFLSPLAYQTFIYHSMLIVLGVAIYWDRDTTPAPRHFKTTLLWTAVMALLSLYLNSLLAEPVYEGSALKSVEYTTNFFFTYRAPVALQLTTKAQWYLYLVVISAVAVGCIFLMYIPVFKSARKRILKDAEKTD